MTRFNFLAVAAVILTVTAIVTPYSSALAAERCPSAQPNEVPRNHVVLVFCVWENIGPARDLRWSSQESRGNIRKALYKHGTLYKGCLDVVNSLREMNLTKGVSVLLLINGNPLRILPEDNGRHAISFRVCGGRVPIAIPRSIMTKTWWIQFDTKEGPRLLYTNPNPDGGFTKKVGRWNRPGYSELGYLFGPEGDYTTRLNTVAP